MYECCTQQLVATLLISYNGITLDFIVDNAKQQGPTSVNLIYVAVGTGWCITV